MAQFSLFSCSIFKDMIWAYLLFSRFSETISVLRAISKFDVDMIIRPIAGMIVIGRYHCLIYLVINFRLESIP